MARTGSLQEYESDYQTMETLPDWVSMAAHVAASIARTKGRYMAVEELTSVPWAVIAVIHQMEGSRDFSTHLANGEPLNQKTELEPKGIGPFKTWEAGAVAALQHDKMKAAGFADGKEGWTVGEIGKALERYNGGGYFKRGIRSPYLWSGSNHGLGVGKYRENKQGSWYDANCVSQQVGAMVLLRALESLGEWKPVYGAKAPPQDATAPISPAPEPKPGPIRYGEKSERVRGLQAWLNSLPDRHGDALAVDGEAGPATDAAFRAVFGRPLLRRDGFNFPQDGVALPIAPRLLPALITQQEALLVALRGAKALGEE